MILTLLFAPMMTLLSLAQGELYAHDSHFPFIIISKDTVSELPKFSDEEFYNTSSGVIFKVNRTEIPADDKAMKLYRDSILPWVNRNHLQLRKVFIRGAASPEGPYANNYRLGRGRSQALLNELRKELLNQYVETDIDVSCITEDYGYLCLLMKEKNDPDYDLVKSIYDECQGDELCCKKKLQAAKNKQLWARLLKEYFPQLRSARFILWFSEPDEEHAPLKHVDLQSFKTDEPLPTFTPKPNPSLGFKKPLEAPKVEYTRRHIIAVRTNLLHDFFYMPSVGWSPSPNIQFEYYPLDGHYTYNVGMTWGTHRHWDRQEFFQVRDFQLELRRYFHGGGEFMGAYLGAFLEGNVYGIGLSKEDGWEGEGGGAGLTVGYVVPLNKKKNLRLEFMAAAGFYRTYYDPYVYGNPVTGTENGKYYYNYLGTASAFKKRNHVMSWMGPTNLGIQLTYDIIYRKKTIKRVND